MCVTEQLAVIKLKCGRQVAAALLDISVPPIEPHNIGTLLYQLQQTGGRPYDLTFLCPHLFLTISVHFSITFYK
jgi:hypothetical protein